MMTRSIPRYSNTVTSTVLVITLGEQNNHHLWIAFVMPVIKNLAINLLTTFI